MLVTKKEPISGDGVNNSVNNVNSGPKWTVPLKYTVRPKVDSNGSKRTVIDDSGRSWANVDGQVYKSGRLRVKK